MSGTDHPVLYCSIQEKQSSTALLQKLENSHSCCQLLDNLVNYPYVHTWDQVLLVGYSEKYITKSREYIWGPKIKTEKEIEIKTIRHTPQPVNSDS